MTHVFRSTIIAIAFLIGSTAVAADPVRGRFDYPIAPSPRAPYGTTVFASRGFTVTGTVWEEVGETNIYGPLSYECRLWGSPQRNIRLDLAQADATPWGGFYNFIKPFQYKGPTAHLELWVKDDAGQFQWVESVTINVLK